MGNTTEKLVKLIKEWEVKELAAENPAEVIRCQTEITRLKKLLNEQEIEMLDSWDDKRANSQGSLHDEASHHGGNNYILLTYQKRKKHILRIKKTTLGIALSLGGVGAILWACYYFTRDSASGTIHDRIEEWSFISSIGAGVAAFVYTIFKTIEVSEHKSDN